jgi:hypothetical protein
MPQKLSNTAKRATAKGLGSKSPGFKGKLSNTSKRSTSKTTAPKANDRKIGKTTMDTKGGSTRFGKSGGY